MNIISDANIGGAGRVLLNYLKQYNKAQFEMSVVIPHGSLLKDLLAELGVKIYEADTIADKSFALKSIKELKTIITGANPDIVHTHGSLSGRVAAKKCGKAVVFTRHSVFPVSPLIRKGPGRLVNKLLNERYADRIIAVSPAAKINLTDGGISDSLIDVVMNGTQPMTRVSETERLRLRNGLGITEFAAGILARIEDYKGHMLILDAAKMLKDEGRKIKILIAGAGPYEDDVRAHISELGLSDTVLFLGFVEDVQSLLNILDVQLNASYGTEATSMSLIEGMSIGLPAIVSDYGGNPYVIQDGENGLVFKSRDSVDLKECLERLMGNPDYLKTLGERAIETYNKNFTVETFVQNTEKVYQKALEVKNHGK